MEADDRDFVRAGGGSREKGLENPIA